MEDSILEILGEVIPKVMKGWDGYSIRIEAERTRKPNGEYQRTLNVDLSNDPGKGNFVVPYAVLELNYHTDEVKVNYWKGQE